MSDQEKSVYGLIGYPLGHSLSPLMHNTAFAALGVDAVYKLFPLKEDQLGGFFAELHENTSPIFGLNVTIPYKEKVIKYLDSLSPYAQKIQAVNTIVVSDHRTLIGHNTDGPGFLTHLKELHFQTERKRVAIIGAGGVTRAILAVLCLLPERPAVIRIYDRETQKAHSLLQDLKNNNIDVSIVTAVETLSDLNIAAADVLINATPVGMHPKDPCLVSEGLLHPQMSVYDVIYNPSETKLLKLAKAKGARVSNGLGMLFYQGVLALQHWADIELNEEIKEKMLQSLMKGLQG